VTLDPKLVQQLLNPQPNQQQLKPPNPTHLKIALTATIGSCLGLVLLWIGSFLADSGESYGIGGAVAPILIAPTAFVLVPCICIMISVRKVAATNYGLSVTSIVFSSLTLTGAFINGIIFAIIGGSESNNNYYYNDYYYNQYCTGCRRDNPKLISAGFGIVALSSFVLFFSQLSILIVSCLEVKRVVRTSSQQQQIIIVQQAPNNQNGQPQFILANGQPQQFAFMQPQYVNQQGQPQFMQQGPPQYGQAPPQYGQATPQLYYQPQMVVNSPPIVTQTTESVNRSEV